LPLPLPLPLDHPTAERPHRLYFALTNRCNRSCPWCSTCSSPSGGTFLSLDLYRAALPREGEFQVQLEGGEPTVHPRFWDFVRVAREHPWCTHLVVCTNGLLLPRAPRRLRAWVERLGAPATVKISVNHHLLEQDDGLLELCQALRDQMDALGAGRQLVVNVRLRRGYEEDDRRVREAVERAGLLAHANVFFLQSYGFARDEGGWEPPRPVSDRFTLVNPDGRIFGPDLVRRSEAMRVLP
jgi:MoaA/NifB/PqqE/SkfB family radical SAM enzyme